MLGILRCRGNKPPRRFALFGEPCRDWRIAASLTTRVVSDLEEAQRHLQEWDELAVASSKPYCCPAWMTGWWLHAAPPSSELRLFLVFDDKELVGVAPFFVDEPLGILTRYRVLGARCSSRLDLLARPGMETVVGSAFASALAGVSPRPDVVMFEGIARESPWPSLLAEGWPGRAPTLTRQFSQPSPTVSLAGLTYEDWFSSKSKHFRKGARRELRELEREDASFRLASTEEEIERGLESFSRLHHARWSRRGGSGVLNRRVERMLGFAGRQLVRENRFRLWSIEVKGRPISSHIFLSAGGEMSYWLGGFDDEWARLQPSILTILAAIEQGFAVGDSRLDLGTGGQDYKYRLADSADDIDWTLLVPAGVRSVFARMQVLPERARLAAAKRLPPEAKRTLRALLGRVAGRRHPQETKSSG
jgi:CelD/BcsL family acetyltransferase involved in cellulose biosynthesis